MTTINVSAAGQNRSFEEPAVVTIGRDPACDFTFELPSVSRRHAELRSDGNGWVLVDANSSGGTYLNGNRVSEVRITGRTSVRLGAVDGPEVVVSPPGEARPAPVMPAQMPAAMAQTMVPGAMAPVGGPPGPGGFGSGPGLLVRTDGGSKRFGPGTVVRLGRDPGSEVAIDDPAVSRLHATVEMRPDGNWWFVDRSTAGTFDGEDRVAQRKLESPTTLMLGHPTAGAEVEIVPIVAAAAAQKSIAKKKRNKALLLTGVGLGALVLVGGGLTAVALMGDDDKPGPSADTGLSHEELARAKAATVFLIAYSNGEPTHTGSGSIVSEDGLILTNAHVADAGSPGFVPQDVSPDYLVVGIPPAGDPDGDVELRYRAEPVATDGPLDLSIIKINSDAEGNPVSGDLDLPKPLPLGDSDDVETGDELMALGFPALASVDIEDPFKRPVTVTQGVASTIKTVAPFGAGAWIDSDLRLGSGNSGGPTINDDGEIIGVNTEVRTAETQADTGEGGTFTSGSALMRPSKWVEAPLKAAEAGQEYTSEWIDDVEVPDEPDVPAQATVTSAGWTLDGQGGCEGTSSVEQPQTMTGVVAPVTIFAEFYIEGLSADTPIQVRFVDETGLEYGRVDGAWDGEDGCANASFDVPEGMTAVGAEFWVGTQNVLTNPVYLEP